MKYIKRIVDEVIDKKLKITGGVVIKGPKWCGKTTSAKQYAKSVLDLQNTKTKKVNQQLADYDISLLLEGDKPRLIDEWQVIPEIWNAIRTDIDEQNKKGLYLLTGSVVPTNENEEKLHTGIGRISFVEMKPMTLFESGESNGSISLKDILENKIEIKGQKSDINYQKLSYLICRGGWPSALELDEDISPEVAKEYIKVLTESDISRIDGKTRNPELARHILRSYARHVSTLDTNKTILEDIQFSYGNISEPTLIDYLNTLKKLYVIEEVPSWNPNIRSKTGIRTSPKKNLLIHQLALLH